MIIGVTCFAQTATNFTTNDCNGVSHDLFTELDAGKVIVVCSVDPCGGCIAPSKTTYNIVNSYQTTNPNRVFYYLADDWTVTTCAALNSWANSNGIPESSYSLRFPNVAISMTPYGGAAMPRILVFGGNAHTIFYNAITANVTNLQTAINNALAATEVDNLSSELFNVSLFPVPYNIQTTLSINLKSISNVKVEVYNIVGKKVLDVYNSQLKSGDNQLNIKTSDFDNGMYFIKVSVADKIKTIKLIVSE